MCTGLELLVPLVGAGLSGAGTIIQQREAQADAKRRAAARNRELQENLQKQREYADEAMGYLDERVEALNPEQQKQQLETEQTEGTERLQANLETPNVADVSLSGSAPKVVESEFAKKFRKSLDTSKERAANAARLGGYNASWLNTALDNVAAGRRINTVNNFSRSTAALLPSWQDLAEAEVARGPSGVGSILSGLGGAVGSIGGGYYG